MQYFSFYLQIYFFYIRIYFNPMRIKKLKRIKKIVQHLTTQNYRTPFRIILTPQFLFKINKQKLGYSHFSSILSRPKLYITNCSYKFYKGLHKHENKDKLSNFTNNERKKWKKQRFMEDLVKHCTIKKCDHDSKEHLECTLEMAKTKKYILGGETENIEDLPIVFCRNSELFLEMKI